MAKIVEPFDSDELQFIIKPSQLVNIWWLLLTFLVFGWVLNTEVAPYWPILIPGFIWFCNWLIIKCWSFRFHEKTISERKGVFSVLTTEVHYFRIKSVRLEQPLHLRIFGLSNVVLITSDPLIPVLRLYGIEHGEQVKNEIKEQISLWRRERTVKEQDIHPLM